MAIETSIPRSPRNNQLLVAIFTLSAVILGLVTFVNHYYFNTSAHDLGIYNNMIYDYAHFRWNDCMLIEPPYENKLSDHFVLLPILLSPLYWLFGSYTLLIVQWAAILFGGWGIYKNFEDKENRRVQTTALLATVQFFSVYGIYSALAFDYHDNVVAAMMLPWVVFYFRKRKIKKALLFFIIILISKENMALWAFFIGLGMALKHRKDRGLLLFALVMSVVSIAYFLLVVKVVMPALANAGRSYNHFNYSLLGETMGEAVKALFTRPWYSFKLLFTNTSGNPYYDGIKQETYYMLFMAGGVCLFLRPYYLIMALPILGQKMFSEDPVKWGICAHYSIEFVPLLTLAAFEILKNIRPKKLAIGLMILVTLTTIYSNRAKTLERKSIWYSPEKTNIFTSNHYRNANFSASEMRKALKVIPDYAPTSASSEVVPHISARDFIYLFPAGIKQSDYVVVTLNSHPYPMRSSEKRLKKLNELAESKRWETIYDENGTRILKRTAPDH